MKELGNKILRIGSVDVDTFSVKLSFTDGFSGRASLAPIFSKPKGLAAEIMRGGMFDKCFVEAGALAWPNGFELCPDAIRRWMNQQDRIKARKKAA